MAVAWVDTDAAKFCWLLIAISLDDCTPEVFLSADQVVVDDFDQCCREEKLLHRLVQLGRFSRAKVAATLGEVVAGLEPLSNRPGTTTYVNPMEFPNTVINSPAATRHSLLAKPTIFPARTAS